MQITGLVVTPDNCGGSTAVIHFRDKVAEDDLRRLLKINHVRYGDWLRLSDAVELTGTNEAYIRDITVKYSVPYIIDCGEKLIHRKGLMQALMQAIDEEEQGA